MMRERDTIDRWKWNWESRNTRCVYGHGYAFTWGDGRASVYAEGKETGDFNVPVASFSFPKRFANAVSRSFKERVVRPWCEEAAKAHARHAASKAIERRIRKEYR
jgi:hypothetical protein